MCQAIIPKFPKFLIHHTNFLRCLIIANHSTLGNISNSLSFTQHLAFNNNVAFSFLCFFYMKNDSTLLAIRYFFLWISLGGWLVGKGQYSYFLGLMIPCRHFWPYFFPHPRIWSINGLSFFQRPQKDWMNLWAHHKVHFIKYVGGEGRNCCEETLIFFVFYNIFKAIFSIFFKEINFSNEFKIFSYEIKFFLMKSSCPSPTEKSYILPCSCATSMFKNMTWW